MQRFHCLGRMHPLVMSVPRHVNIELRHPGLTERLKRESRIIVEFQSFHELAVHLDDIFNVWLVYFTELRELSLAPAGGSYSDANGRPLSLDWMEKKFGEWSYFLRDGWVPRAGFSSFTTTPLQRLQLAIPLPSKLIVTLAAQLMDNAPNLEVLEIDRNTARIFVSYVCVCKRLCFRYHRSVAVFFEDSVSNRGDRIVPISRTATFAMHHCLQSGLRNRYIEGLGE